MKRSPYILDSAAYLMCGNILNPAGPQLVHGDEAWLGADGNPSGGQAMGHLYKKFPMQIYLLLVGETNLRKHNICKKEIKWHRKI